MSERVTRRSLLADTAVGAGGAVLASPPALAAVPGTFAEAKERVRVALGEMGAGKPESYTACWAQSGEATLFGAWGPIEKGYERLKQTFLWVGSRFKSGPLVPEDVVSFESGDLAYTVGFERGEVVVDGGPRKAMTIRVTHIYRRIDGAWRLIHRHAIFLQPTSVSARAKTPPLRTTSRLVSPAGCATMPEAHC